MPRKPRDDGFAYVARNVPQSGVIVSVQYQDRGRVFEEKTAFHAEEGEIVASDHPKNITRPHPSDGKIYVKEGWYVAGPGYHPIHNVTAWRPLLGGTGNGRAAMDSD